MTHPAGRPSGPPPPRRPWTGQKVVKTVKAPKSSEGKTGCLKKFIALPVTVLAVLALALFRLPRPNPRGDR